MGDLLLMHKLTEAIIHQKAAFYCGGTTSISSSKDGLYSSVLINNEPVASPPVVIRWDIPTGEGGRKFCIPSSDQAAEIKELLADCVPASFGVGGEEVLDETYRKAAKLDSSQF